jgi:hypothetical protein
MLGKGVPIYKVSKMLGHSTVLTTEAHYGHLDRTVLSEEIHHINSIISTPSLETLIDGNSAQAVNGSRKQENSDAPQNYNS